MENKETMDNKAVSKPNQPSEIFVLPPLLLENFGINLGQNYSTEESGTYDVNNERESTNINQNLSDHMKCEESPITETENLMKNSIFINPTFVSTENHCNCDTVTDNTEKNNGLNLIDTPVIHDITTTELYRAQAETINSQNDASDISSTETVREISDSSLLKCANYEQNVGLHSPKHSHIAYNNSKLTERQLLNVENDIEHNLKVFEADKHSMKSVNGSNSKEIFTVPVTSNILPISTAKYNTLNDLKISTDSNNTNIFDSSTTMEKQQCLLNFGDTDGSNDNVHCLNNSDETKVEGKSSYDKNKHIHAKESKSDKDGLSFKTSIKTNTFKSGGDYLSNKMLTDDNIDAMEEEGQPKKKEIISISTDEVIKGIAKNNKLINDSVNTCQVRWLESLKETDTQALPNVTSSEFKNIDQLDTAKISSDITLTGVYESIHADKVFIDKSKSVISGIEDSCTEENKNSSQYDCSFLHTALYEAKSIEDNAPLDYGLNPLVADANKSKKCLNAQCQSIKVNTGNIDIPKNTTTLQSYGSKRSIDANRINILQIKNIEAMPFTTANKCVNSNQIVRGRLEDIEILKSKIVNKKYCKDTLQCNNTYLNQDADIMKEELKLPSQCSQNNSHTNINLIANYLKQVTNMRSQNVHRSQSNKSHKNKISKLSAQGVQKRSGDEQQASNSSSQITVIDTKMTLPKTYKRNKRFDKRIINISPQQNDITEQALQQTHAIDSTQEVVHIKPLQFSLYADFGHISYDNSNYDNLENFNYEIKSSNDCTIEDLIMDKNEETNYQFKNDAVHNNLKGSVFDELSCIESDSDINEMSYDGAQKSNTEYTQSSSANECTYIKSQTGIINNDSSCINKISNQELISNSISQDKTTESDNDANEMSYCGAQKSNTESTKSSTANDCTHIKSQTEIINNDSSCIDKISNQELISDSNPQDKTIESDNDTNEMSYCGAQKSNTESTKSSTANDCTHIKSQTEIINNDSSCIDKISNQELISDSNPQDKTIESDNDTNEMSYCGAQKSNTESTKSSTANDCTHIKSQTEIINNDSSFENEFMNNCAFVHTDSMRNTPSEFVKGSSDFSTFCLHRYNQLSNEEQPIIQEECKTLKKASKRISQNDLLTTKKFKKEVILDVSADQNNSNELTSSYPEKLKCDVCKKKVKMVEWITHVCSKNTDTPSSKSGNNVPKCLQRLLKKHGFLKCSMCNKQLICVELFLIHMNKCHASEKVEVSMYDQSKSEKSEEVYSNVNNQSELSTDYETRNSLTVVSADTDEMISPDECVCGVCHAVIKKKDWIIHTQAQHNYLAWRQGEISLDFSKEEVIKNHLISLAQKIGLLICNTCGRKQNRYKRKYDKYIDIYLDHVKNCQPQASKSNIGAEEGHRITERHADVNKSNESLLINEELLLPTENIMSHNTTNDTYSTCGICGQLINDKEWTNHIQMEHNYLAWKKGEPELDLNNPELIQTYLVELTKNIKSLICNKCDKKFKRYRRTYEQYINFFLNHIKECNAKNSVTCAVCSLEINQNDWQKHQYMKHYNLAWRLDLDEPVDLHNTWVIQKLLKEYKEIKKKLVCNNCGASRSSSIGFYAHIITCQKTEEEIAPYRFKCEICNGISLNVYRQQHMAAHKVQELNIERKKLKLEAKTLKEEENIPILSGKRKAADKAIAVIEKYKSTASDLKHKCPTCSFSTDCEQELKKHKCDKEDISGSDSEGSTKYFMQSSDNSSSDNYDEDTSDEESWPLRERRKKSSSDLNAAHKLFIPLAIKNPDAYLIDCCKEFKELHFTEETLFSAWQHSEYQPVNQEDIGKYLPTVQESCQVHIDSEPITYKRFEARLTKGYSIFTGGCLSCIAWAPSRKADSTQYLAVVAHNTPDIPTRYEDRLYEHPALLQIWTFEDLLGTTLPVLSLGIAHEYGTIWAMDWCPSGARDPFCADADGPLNSRMGLLAIACSNGIVYILSIPQPSQLSHKFYKFKHVAELRLYRSSNQRMYQATAISWSKQKDHSIIAVGYADGYIAMFFLNTESPLSRYKENGIEIFHPYYRERSMRTPITGISIHPSDDVSSFGADVGAVGYGSRTGAVMRVNPNGNACSMVSTNQPTNGVLFMPEWLALYCTVDDKALSMRCSELETWGVERRVGNAQAAAACHTCARLFTWAPPFVRVLRAHPVYPAVKRRPIAQLKLVRLDGKRGRIKANDDLTIKLEPNTYEDTIKKYGIQFKLITGNSERTRGMNVEDDLSLGRPDRFPLADVRRLAPCPADSYHKWVAIALHAGLVFVIRT